MQINDLSLTVYAPELHRGVETRSVGWLGDTVPSTGALPLNAIEALRTLFAKTLHDDGDMGEHECQICQRYAGRGEIWLEHGDFRYVAPAMILHYCEMHCYLPPKEFVDALLQWAD